MLRIQTGREVAVQAPPVRRVAVTPRVLVDQTSYLAARSWQLRVHATLSPLGGARPALRS